MNNKMNFEERQASALDAHLTRLQTNQPSTPTSEAERLASGLHILKEKTKLNPAIRVALAQRLQESARQKKNRKTFLSLPRMFPAGGNIMNAKRIFAFASAAALLLLLAFVFWSQSPQPLASLPTDTPTWTPTTSETAATQEPEASPTSIRPSPTTAPVLPTAAPSLPVLGDWMQNSGMGGGGLPYAFTLGIELPAGTTSLTAYLQRHPGELDQAMMLDLAHRLGLDSPEVYTIGENVGTIVIQGQKEIVMGGPFDFSYVDRSVFNLPGGRYYYPDDKVPAPEVVEAAAKAFLEQANLLDAPYEVAVFDEFARFYHVLDGSLRVDDPFAVVTVSPEGVAGMVVYHSQQTDPVGTYDLISAVEAWALVSDSEAARRWHTSLQLAVDRNPPVWVRTYTPGMKVDINGPLTIYSGATPYIRANGLQVIADPAQLQALADTYLALRESTMDVEAPIRVWGVVGQDGQTLEMQGFGDGTVPTFWTGSISKTASGDGLLTSEDGQTYTLPALPDDLPDGTNVFVMGGLMEGRIEWTLIQKSVEGWTPAELPVPVTIERAVLGYFAPDGMTLAQNQVTGYEFWTLQPVWRFTGRTADGDTVTVYVQAVK